MEKINLDKIKKIFEEFDNEENQQTINLMCGRFDDLPLCNFDIITCKYIEKSDIIFNELIPQIKKLIDDKSFQNSIVQLEKNSARLKLKSIVDRLLTTKYSKEETKNALRFYRPQIKQYINKIKNLDFKNFLLDCDDIFNGISEIKDIKNDVEVYRENYKYICISNILFKNYKRDKASKNRFNIPVDNALEKLYIENNIDLNSIDTQYNKYKLLTIDENIDIIISNIPKVYDTKIGVYLSINEIEEDFLQFLKELREKGYISSLALRPEYSNVSKDLKDLSVGLEEKEYGKIFSFENLGNPITTKLYSSNNFDNKLWIIIDKENITFEEILEDFEVYDDSIVTQVIHLQYKQEENQQYIIYHIDHEYIFYTDDEYIERENNPMQKGEAKRRFKTFKIDKSEIPFVLEDGSFFLYKVLDTYFVNKDLIKEYFENVLEIEN